MKIKYSSFVNPAPGANPRDINFFGATKIHIFVAQINFLLTHKNIFVVTNTMKK